MSKLEIYQNEAGGYRWRTRYGGDMTADSGERYASKDGGRSIKGMERKDSGTETAEV